MEKEGMDFVNKLITRVKPEKAEPSHVGGPTDTSEENTQDNVKLNRYGLGKSDY